MTWTFSNDKLMCIYFRRDKASHRCIRIHCDSRYVPCTANLISLSHGYPIGQ